MELVTDLFVLGSWVGALLFVVRFAQVKWRASAAGRNVMAFMGVIAIVLTLAVVSIWWPDAWWRPYARVGSWAAIFAVIWHRNWTFMVEQREGRQALRAERDNRSAREHTGDHGN